ncbi:putative metal-binding motif-containing protein, partial [Candidatus Poribacteria bacterium]|nr:putative metal-binding motif-containing protein [Candidatus Poribacteria bacterium]
MRFKVMKVMALVLLAMSSALLLARDVSAEPTYFTANCASCHSNDTVTCNGCHSHGVWSNSSRSIKNLKAATDLAQYKPGQTVNVTLSGGYRSGWVRGLLYDNTGKEIARVTGPTGMGDDGTGSLKQQFPILLSAPAPSAPGFYTWTAAWFGSPYDRTNRNVFPHVEERVATNQFEVVTPPPVCADSDQDGYQDIACNADVTKGGGDCNDKNPAISPGVGEIAYNGIDDDCNTSTPDDDLDGDGFGIASDCDDTDASVNPAAAEVCSDGIDNDCDGFVDSADPDCAPPPPPDADHDGYPANVDC